MNKIISTQLGENQKPRRLLESCETRAKAICDLFTGLSVGRTFDTQHHKIEMACVYFGVDCIPLSKGAKIRAFFRKPIQGPWTTVLCCHVVLADGHILVAPYHAREKAGCWLAVQTAYHLNPNGDDDPLKFAGLDLINAVYLELDSALRKASDEWDSVLQSSTGDNRPEWLRLVVQ